MDRLAGKVAVVTGGAVGLGAADVRLLVKNGARVIVTDVDEANGKQLCEEIGDRAEFRFLDVCKEDQWIDLMAYIEKEYGQLNILVNNAGVVEVGNIETQTTKDYNFIMAVSVDGAFFGCKHAMPLMKKSGLCSIINMASIAAKQGEQYVLAYCAAKGAVEAMSRSIAAHCALSKYTIRCNTVLPSGIVTPMVMGMGSKMAESGLMSLDDLNAASSQSKLGEPDDIAHTVVFLASDESKFINGASISVDNGMSIVSGVIPE